MFGSKLAKRAVAAFLVSAMLLTACNSEPAKTYSADLIAAKEGVQTVTIDSHSGDKVKDADYSDSNSVKYHYEISMIDGLLTQKVTKEVNAALNKNSGEWDIRTETLTRSSLYFLVLIFLPARQALFISVF